MIGGNGANGTEGKDGGNGGAGIDGNGKITPTGSVSCEKVFRRI